LHQAIHLQSLAYGLPHTAELLLCHDDKLWKIDTLYEWQRPDKIADKADFSARRATICACKVASRMLMLQFHRRLTCKGSNTANRTQK